MGGGDTIHAVSLSDRRPLIHVGFNAVLTERAALLSKRTVLLFDPGVMGDMPKIADDAVFNGDQKPSRTRGPLVYVRTAITVPSETIEGPQGPRLRASPVGSRIESSSISQKRHRFPNHLSTILWCLILGNF